MPTILDTAIKGVMLVKPTCHTDDRGMFYEALRASWFPGERRWVQWNLSWSLAGVLRGLHFHEKQTDFWLVVDGIIRVGLVDLRPNSPSHRAAICLEMSEGDPCGLLIPPGVAHGYRALRETTLMYLLDQEYSGGDEFGVRWNDPALGLPHDWYAGPEPVLSSRDAAAPMLHEARSV